MSILITPSHIVSNYDKWCTKMKRRRICLRFYRKGPKKYQNTSVYWLLLLTNHRHCTWWRPFSLINSYSMGGLKRKDKRCPWRLQTISSTIHWCCPYLALDTTIKVFTETRFSQLKDTVTNRFSDLWFHVTLRRPCLSYVLKGFNKMVFFSIEKNIFLNVVIVRRLMWNPSEHDPGGRRRQVRTRK